MAGYLHKLFDGFKELTADKVSASVIRVLAGSRMGSVHRFVKLRVDELAVLPGLGT